MAVIPSPRCDICCVTFRTHRGLLRHNALVHKQLPRDAMGRPFIQNNPSIPAGFHDLGFTDFSCRKFPRISQVCWWTHATYCSLYVLYSCVGWGGGIFCNIVSLKSSLASFGFLGWEGSMVFYFRLCFPVFVRIRCLLPSLQALIFEVVYSPPYQLFTTPIAIVSVCFTARLHWVFFVCMRAHTHVHACVC